MESVVEQRTFRRTSSRWEHLAVVREDEHPEHDAWL
jgi:hypothetical protein